MEFVLLWIIFSVLAGVFAANRGFGFIATFVFSLLLSPLVGFVSVLVRKPRPTAEQLAAANEEAAASKKCPFCAETIKAEAIVCRFCGKDQPARARSDDQDLYDWLANQNPPIKLSSLLPEELDELRKRFKRARASP